MYRISQLKGYLPHAGKMCWPDFVELFEKDRGTCSVELRSEALYCTDGVLRQSSCVELMAQSYGYIIAANVKKETGKVTPIASAYLVGMKKVKFLNDMPEAGETVYIDIREERRVGKISFVRGRVYSKEENKTYCEAIIKLYSD